jgi:hypothetical protein
MKLSVIYTGIFIRSTMFGRQERIAVCLLVGVAVSVIVAHAVLGTIGKQPFARPFTANASEGELVIVEGTVERAMLIENGGHLLLRVDNLTVFIPSGIAQNLSVHNGDTIFAYGIVQTYRGNKEVVINAADDLHITTVP